MAGEYGPEFDRFVARTRAELVPKIKESNAFISISPSSPDNVDIKFAVELGLAIMFDKPIISVIAPGTPIPEKLARVVDRFVEMDFRNGEFTDPTQQDRLVKAVEEVLENKK